jgi:hypothetical protein
MMELLLFFLVLPMLIGWRMNRIGYSGLLWVLLSLLFTPLVALVLASSLPNRNVERRRGTEWQLLNHQLQSAGIPVGPGDAPVPRATVSEDRTNRGPF